MRGVLTALLVLALAPAARAQEDDGGGSRVATTAVYIPAEGTDPADVSAINAGIRRGLRDVNGIRYVHPADVLLDEDERAPPEAVQLALEDLDAIADMVRDGDPQEAERRAREAIAVFEENLIHVRRAALVDGYLLEALARCRQRNERRCAAAMAYVLTFREAAEYDQTRYPPEYADLFEQTRTRVVAGARGALRVETSPPGAEVFIDGRSIGPSPAVAEGLLAGEHYVTIKLIGYRRVMARVTVAEEGSSVEYQLVPSREARKLRDMLPRIQEELGEEIAETNGPIHGMAAYLFVNQVIIGVVEPEERGRLRVALYLYDLRTRFLLAQREATLSGGEEGEEQAARLARDLYQRVDLRGTVAPPEERTERFDSPQLWERWWFWAAVGVVVASGVVLLTVGGGGEACPESWTCIDGTFQ